MNAPTSLRNTNIPSEKEDNDDNWNEENNLEEEKETDSFGSEQSGDSYQYYEEFLREYLQNSITVKELDSSYYHGLY